MKTVAAATVALLALAGCGLGEDSEPVAVEETPTSGASINVGADTPYEEQRNSWLTECHDLLDSERGVTHDISWENSVSLDNNEHRLIGTATQFRSDTEFLIVCHVTSGWTVELDTIRSAIPRENGTMLNVRYSPDFNHEWPGNASDAKLDDCLDVLSEEYGPEAVSVVIDFSSVNRTEKGVGHVVDGTATGSVTNTVPMEFACSVPNSGEATLMHFYEAR